MHAGAGAAAHATAPMLPVVHILNPLESLAAWQGITPAAMARKLQACVITQLHALVGNGYFLGLPVTLAGWSM